MIPKRAIVSGLLFVVAVLAFAGLGYQQVPVIITQTKAETFIRFQVGARPTLVESASVTTTTELVGDYQQSGYNPGNCYGFDCGGDYENDVPVYATEVSTTFFPVWSSPTVSYSYTATSFVAVSSTSLVPASDALGLSQEVFATLAYVVIGSLALLVVFVFPFRLAYASLKSTPSYSPEQMTTTQFVKAQPSCIKCGAELPPASEFCNKCGAKQEE